MKTNKYLKLVDRFLKYVKVNTRSNEDSLTVPSDPKEVVFLNNLSKELTKIGFKNVRTKKDGYVFAEIPASAGAKKVSTIGFISHVDTADFNSENVNPQIVENYDGESEIKLNEYAALSPEDFPFMKNYKGHDLITTDGTTLLGADDKSGVAEMITAGEYLINHPEIKHGKLVFAFGPDEEIGIGADNFDVKDFGAEFAFTVDGGPLGELQWETFNAAGASLQITGIPVHPGTAKDLLVNPIQVGIDVINELPEAQRPENTAKRQGFYYVTSVEGDTDKALFKLIIRDHDRKRFQAKKEKLNAIVKRVNKKYFDRFGINPIILVVNDQYYNMGEVLQDNMEPVKLAKKSMKDLKIKPVIEPIRGGTDGSKISFLGLPTPNLFAGGENMHGRFEFVSIQVMEKATDLIIQIASNHAK